LLSGFFRTRGDLGYNWDLNRGPTPTSGVAIWPAAYVDAGRSRTLSNLDMRLRTDLQVRVGYGVSVHGRLHVLDNLRFGSTPEGDYAAGVINQRSPASPIEVRQLFGEVLLPIGVLRVGRMGAPIDWGTGFFVNSGNGIDDDFGDVGDRISFATPLGGLIWSAMYEVSAGGPGTEAVRPEIRPALDLDPRDDVRTVALAVARWDTSVTRRRRLAAARPTVNFGLFGSYRTQDADLAPGTTPAMMTAIHRGLSAFAGDGWIRADLGALTLEAELAFVRFSLENASTDPGVTLNVPVTGTQVGGVLRADWRGGPRLFARVELGFASGDDAPGMGARPAGATPTQPGDLDGPQFNLNSPTPDTTIDNFRFHPNYRVDLILWRRIIGTVTDAVYLRPMVRYRLGPMLTLEGAVIGSTALAGASTPSGEAPLGVETDLAVMYEQEHGFFARLDYGLLIPLSGFREVTRGLEPSPAHALHLVLAYRL
jgi:uncharacterized protein (TIGR04551 family)